MQPCIEVNLFHMAKAMPASRERLLLLLSCLQMVENRGPNSSLSAELQAVKVHTLLELADAVPSDARYACDAFTLCPSSVTCLRKMGECLLATSGLPTLQERLREARNSPHFTSNGEYAMACMEMDARLCLAVRDYGRALSICQEWIAAASKFLHLRFLQNAKQFRRIAVLQLLLNDTRGDVDLRVLTVQFCTTAGISFPFALMPDSLRNCGIREPDVKEEDYFGQDKPDVDLVLCSWLATMLGLYDKKLLSVFQKQVCKPSFVFAESHPGDHDAISLAEIAYLYANMVRFTDATAANVRDALDKCAFADKCLIALQKGRSEDPTIVAFRFGLAHSTACSYGIQSRVRDCASSLLSAKHFLGKVPSLAALEWHAAAAVLGRVIGCDVGDHEQHILQTASGADVVGFGHSESKGSQSSGSSQTFSSSLPGLQLLSLQRLTAVIGSLSSLRITEYDLSSCPTNYSVVAQHYYFQALDALAMGNVSFAVALLQSARDLARCIDDCRTVATTIDELLHHTQHDPQAVDPSKTAKYLQLAQAARLEWNDQVMDAVRLASAAESVDAGSVPLTDPRSGFLSSSSPMKSAFM